MSDNQTLSDAVRVTWCTSAVTALQGLTAKDTQNNNDIGVYAQAFTNEKNRLLGSVCAAPTDTAHAASQGGSIVAQVNVGARQW